MDKALRLLTFLGDQKRDTGVLEIARQLGMNSTTTYRLLRTMEQHKFVRQNPTTTKYGLGTKLVQLGEAFLQSTELRSVARPLLLRLMELSRETVHLMALDGDMGIYLDRVDGPQRVRVASAVGQREYLHCSGVGKAILAYLDPSRRAEILRKHGLPRLAENTIVDPGVLEEHLKTVRRAGYAIDNEEGVKGVRCVGAPIFDRSKNAVASISISGPAFRLPVAALERLSDDVKSAGDEISAALGYISVENMRPARKKRSVSNGHTRRGAR